MKAFLVTRRGNVLVKRVKMPVLFCEVKGQHWTVSSRWFELIAISKRPKFAIFQERA